MAVADFVSTALGQGESVFGWMHPSLNWAVWACGCRAAVEHWSGGREMHKHSR